MGRWLYLAESGGEPEPPAPIPLTISGLTGDAASGNGAYTGNATVGLDQVPGSAYLRETGIQGEHGEITYNAIADSWDGWDNIAYWTIYKSDGGATWDAVATGAFKGSPIGAWDSGVSAAGDSFTVTCTDNTNEVQNDDSGTQPRGVITVYKGDTFCVNAGAYANWPEDPYIAELDSVEVDGVPNGSWGGSFANVQANHTFHAIYSL